MLKFFRRRRRPTLGPAERAESLRIRNLLDDPRLQAVMGDTPDGTADSAMVLRRIDRQRRTAEILFGVGRTGRRAA